MRFYTRVLVLSACLVLPAWGRPLNQLNEDYSYLQVQRIHEVDLEGAGYDEEGDGYSGEMSVSMTPNSFLGLRYSAADNKNGDLDTGSIWTGGRVPLAKALDAYGGVGYEYLDFDSSIAGFEGDGYGLRLGLRLFVMDRVELSAEAHYADYGDEDDDVSGINVGVDGRFGVFRVVVNLVHGVALTGEYLTGKYEVDDSPVVSDVDRDDIRFGIRWYFLE